MTDHLLRVLRLKDEVRSGWELRGVHEPESVAGHSWSTAYLCLLYAAEAGVNRCRAVEIAVVHDLAETVTGDVATRVAQMDDTGVIERKQQREAAAMDELAAALSSGQSSAVLSLWKEYEDRATPEALFVRDMNLVDMCAQALLYERDGRYDPGQPNEHFPDFSGLDEFFATTRRRLSTSVGLRLFDELHDAYAKLPVVKARGGPSLTPHADARRALTKRSDDESPEERLHD